MGNFVNNLEKLLICCTWCFLFVDIIMWSPTCLHWVQTDRFIRSFHIPYTIGTQFGHHGWSQSRQDWRLPIIKNTWQEWMKTIFHYPLFCFWNQNMNTMLQRMKIRKMSKNRNNSSQIWTVDTINREQVGFVKYFEMKCWNVCPGF